MFVDPRSVPVFRLLCILAAAIPIFVLLAGFGYDGEGINLVAGTLVWAIGLGFLLRRRGFARVATAIEGWALLLFSLMAVAILSVLFSTLKMPLADPFLVAADRVIMPFLSWPDMAFGLAAKPHLTRMMCAIYLSLSWQPFALIAALALANREAVIWRFVNAWALTLAIVVIVFSMMPSVTPYVYYGISREQVSALTVDAGWHPADILLKIRNGEIRQIALATITGLITCPSFHAAGAVLLMWGFRSVPIVGWAFVALNLLLILTVPFVGSHYFIDVVAGIATAVFAIRVTDPQRSWAILSGSQLARLGQSFPAGRRFARR